jgi:integrase
VQNCVERNAKWKPIIVKAGGIPAARIYRSLYRKQLKSGRSQRYTMFRVVYYTAGERRVETFPNLRDAKERAGSVARAIVNGRVEITGADREQYESAVRQLKPIGIPLHSAIEEYVAARSLLNGDSLLSAVKEHASRRRKIVDKLVAEIVEEMIAAKQRDGASERYLETLRGYLRRFAAAFRTNIGSITGNMIEQWLNGLGKLGPRSRNNIRQTIVTLFHFARARGYLPRGQATEAEEVAKAKDRGGKIGKLKPSELIELLKKANEEFRLYFALAAFTGIRRQELLRLEWSDVNFARGHIEVGKDKAKTATRRLVPIQPNLMQWIASYSRSSGLIFPIGRTPENAIRFAKKIIPYWPNNALRHSFATYRLAQCRDAAAVALEMGTSPAMLFSNYRELSDEHDAAAWFAIVPRRAKNVVPIPATTN